jgi:hypothetical protein
MGILECKIFIIQRQEMDLYSLHPQSKLSMYFSLYFQLGFHLCKWLYFFYRINTFLRKCKPMKNVTCKIPVLTKKEDGPDIVISFYLMEFNKISSKKKNPV